MKYKIIVDSIWEFGQRKDAEGNPHQEDCLFPAFGQGCNDDRLFILCDGMGGHEAGEVASATVCSAMGESILRACPTEDSIFEEQMVQQAMTDALDALDATAARGGATPNASKRMGTTMTMLKLHRDGATIAHVGDSRVYHIRPGETADKTRVLWHTEDHSLVNDLVRMGEISPEEAKNHPQRNVITRAMQPFAERRPKADVHHISDIQEGDVFYLCSDGMLENMDDRQLCHFFSSSVPIGQRADMLRQATQENRDNHSAYIIQITHVDRSQVSSNPQRRKGWLWIVALLLLLGVAITCIVKNRTPDATTVENQSPTSSGDTNKATCRVTKVDSSKVDSSKVDSSKVDSSKAALPAKQWLRINRKAPRHK